MSFKPFKTSLALRLLLLALVCQVVHSKKKSRSIRNYCGEDFIDMWSKCCGYNPQCENAKREIDETFLLDSPNIANKFLWKSSGRRDSVMTKRGTGTNAVEECCVEGCALSEIAEYSCL